MSVSNYTCDRLKGYSLLCFHTASKSVRLIIPFIGNWYFFLYWLNGYKYRKKARNKCPFSHFIHTQIFVYEGDNVWHWHRMKKGNETSASSKLNALCYNATHSCTLFSTTLPSGHRLSSGSLYVLNVKERSSS